MKVMKLNKGWAGLEEHAKAGGWCCAQSYAEEALLPREKAEGMYFLSDWEDFKEKDVTAAPVTFNSITEIGGRHGQRYYNVEASGYLGVDGAVYITEQEFHDKFC